MPTTPPIPPDDSNPDAPDALYETPSQHSAYAHLHASPEFVELRRRYRSFVLPASVAFLVWYFTYVVLSMWAPGLMNTQVVGNINVALVLGLLQFVTTFLIAWLYSRYSNARLDPLAQELDSRYRQEA